MSKTNRPTLIDEIGQFVSVPHTVVKMCGKIGPDAMTLFVYLRYKTNSETNIAFPSIDTICAGTGLTRRRVAVAARALEDSDLLVRERRFSASTFYHLKMPSISTHAAPVEAPTSPDADLSISPDAGLPLVQGVRTIKTDLTKTDPIKRDTTAFLISVIDTYLHQTLNGYYDAVQPVVKIDESPNVISIGVSVPQPALRAAITSLVGQYSRKKWQVRVIHTPAVVSSSDLSARDAARLPLKLAYESAKNGTYSWTREHDEALDSLLAKGCTPERIGQIYQTVKSDPYWSSKVIPFSVIVNNYTAPTPTGPAAQSENCYV